LLRRRRHVDAHERHRGPVRARRGRPWKLTRDEADAPARLTFGGSFDEAANTDVVIEAVPERLEPGACSATSTASPPPTILASNTSVSDRRSPPPTGPSCDRLALGVAGAGDEAGRDRAHREHEEETIATVSEMAARCGRTRSS
jgi:hypothetical protein